MNVNDSEVVAALLSEHRFTPAASEEAADIVLLNTCAIREAAEARIWGRLSQLQERKRLRRLQQPDK
jgi:tRNA-2-methylthio-N6-dimethylallyladenosine synthase